MNVCEKCKKTINEYETYEYRGALSCEDCFDDVIASRESERQQIIKEEDSKTRKLAELDLSNSAIGRENKKIMSGYIEIASKESQRLKNYEGRP